MKEGWEVKKLGEVGKVSMCKRVLKKQTNTDSGVPFYKIGTFGKEPNAYIDEKLYQEFKAKYSFPKKGDVLLSASGTIGRRVVYDGEPAYFQDSNIVWIDNNESEVLNEYLYKFYGYCDWNASKGATISRLYNDDLRRIEIPIPPIEEQKQIVAILDDAFAAIEQAQANIEKNIDNAKELFQSKLNDVFSQKGEGWEEKFIEEVSEVINGYSFKSNDFSAENSVKAIKITNVGINEFVEGGSNNLPKNFLEKYSKVKVQEGDIVLALTRTIISSGLKVARVPNSYNYSLLNQRVAAIIPKDNVVDGEYLYHFFSSKIVYNYVLSNVNTLMQPNLSIKDLKRLKVPITSIDKQIQISKKIEEMSELKNFAIKKYQQKLTNLEDLKKSLLEKAFAGELTCNEPNPTH